MNLTNGFCSQHKGHFQYQMVANRSRNICDVCKAENQRRDDARRHKAERISASEDRAAMMASNPAVFCSCTEAGERLNIGNISAVERNALRKLRQHPKAKNILRLLRDGVSHADLSRWLNPEREMLDYQIEVGEWYQKYEELKASVDSPPEALLMLMDIQHCQRLIARELQHC